MSNYSKEENKKLKELDKGYALIKKGFTIIIKNSPIDDDEANFALAVINKNIGILLRRIAYLFDAQHTDKQFFDIVKNFNSKKGKR